MIDWLPVFTRASSLLSFVCDRSGLLSICHSYYEPICGCKHASVSDGIVKLFCCLFVFMPTLVIGMQQRSYIGNRRFSRICIGQNACGEYVFSAARPSDCDMTHAFVLQIMLDIVCYFKTP